MSRRSYIVTSIKTFREEVQDYTSAAIGEQTYRIYFRYWPAFPATADDPAEDAEIEFLRAERETFKGRAVHWQLVGGPEQDWCMDWLDNNAGLAIDDGAAAMADIAEQFAERRREEAPNDRHPHAGQGAQRVPRHRRDHEGHRRASADHPGQFMDAV